LPYSLRNSQACGCYKMQHVQGGMYPMRVTVSVVFKFIDASRLRLILD
jgi:hypothetical protein